MRHFQVLLLAALGIIAIELGILTVKSPAPVAHAQTQIPTPAPLQSETERRLARDESRIANLEASLRQLNQSFVRHTHEFDTLQPSGLMNYATLAAPGNTGRFLVYVCGTGNTCRGTRTSGPARY